MAKRVESMSKDHLALMILEGASRFADRAAMHAREGGVWRSISYREMAENIRDLAKALIAAGIGKQDTVGIFAHNRPEWAIADFAILGAGSVSVPIYATNTANQAQYIVGDAELKLLFVGDAGQYQKAKSCLPRCPHLKRIVVFDQAVKLDGAESVYLADFLQTGRQPGGEEALEERLAHASRDDIATIIYTSGTTGDPKGVMLTHANLFHQFDALDERFHVDAADRSLCFLPLSHAYERTWSYYVFRHGAGNYYVPDPRRVMEYMREAKPTVMVSVPRLYERIYSTICDRMERTSPAGKMLFRWAMATGAEYQNRRRDRRPSSPFLTLKHAIADRLVLSKIRDRVGGAKKFFSAGGAPLSKEIEEFFFAAGLLICQGYGLTETAPVLTCNAPGAFKFGTVGKPVKGVEIKIGEDGEILARGPNVMKGYYKRPIETEKSFSDGWLRTGDAGEIDRDGFLRITDRLKDILITAHGENVAPLRVETLVGEDHYIDQIVVLGDRRKFIGALIVPFFPAIEQYACERNIPYSSRSELVNHPEIIRFYRRRIDSHSAELAAYERIRRFTLLAEAFTQEAGELTPTLKVKRQVIAEKYKEVIDRMYQK
jgi:long-chain acyl-CoA synthetase